MTHQGCTGITKIIKTVILHVVESDAKIYTLKSSKGEKMLSKAYKRYSGKPDTDDRLIEKFNKETTLCLLLKKVNGLKVMILKLIIYNGLQVQNHLVKSGFPVNNSDYKSYGTGSIEI